MGHEVSWSSYKVACDRPGVVSRWLLEQTRELLDHEAELADLLGALLREGRPLPKPADHRGGPATDMFELSLPPQQVRRIRDRVLAAKCAGRVTMQTRARGLGGFVEAWREILEEAEGSISTQRGEQTVSDAKQVVMGLIEAFNANDLEAVMGHFTDETTYHNMPVEPVSGTSGIREVISGFLGMASAVDWVVSNIVEGDGGVVLTERLDRFQINGKWVELPVMGTFEVRNGKVIAWRDYFDMNQFQSQLA